MFFDDLSQIISIASQVGCAIFVVPDSAEIKLKNSTTIAPLDDKNTISIEQIREAITFLGAKESSERYIVVRKAEKMTPEAANAFLKSLEEPRDHHHIILQTETPYSLLSTILSRAEIFILKTPNILETGITDDENLKTIAKRLIVAKPGELTVIANGIAKKKDDTRAYALEILKTAIEISYKSYFKTKNLNFLDRLPKLIAAYENISKNGHIKLHMVADLL